ncbi:hypothetical protein KO506_04520 [Polaribacter vadi]|uniref:hypothetical protein n=1 Tax=Polaribacter TaxID=52959 RepID=UPI001C083F49|nr:MULTISPECIES: hypothetical protein [Polaribacter]MBU3010651.1 hypothetical protein [Polaribacter vadi]MDO6740462.1 hypothetical protein [Polaribacter sp. 1_MG-2023]
MNESLENLPLYIKAEQINELVSKVADLIEECDEDADAEKKMMQYFKEYLTNSSRLIPAKIAGVYDEEILYDIKMETATIIRREARYILAYTTSLKELSFKDVDYLKLIRDEIEEFRILFAEWVKTFNKQNYKIDGWGLFNPPGVNIDDYDIEDDLPFDNPFDDDDF